MPIACRCSHCGQSYRVKDDLAGKLVRCKQCKQGFRVQAEEPELLEALEEDAGPAAGEQAESESGPDPVIAMVALPKNIPLKADAVARELRQTYGIEVGGMTTSDDNRASVVFDIGEGGMLALGWMPAPIPWSELEGPCATAWHWQEATDVMQAHKAHVIVALMGRGDLSPVERSLLTTRAAAAVAKTHGAVGVYWGNGTTVNPADRFIEMAADASAEQPPVLLWVEVRYAIDDDGSAVSFTTGMPPLGHKEFEIHRTEREPQEVIEMMLDVCMYVLTAGPVLKHGQTFGRTAEERLKIRHGDSMHEGRGGVIILEM